MRGQVRVLVVLVDVSDRQFSVDTARFEELCFSTGSLTTGSVKEYFTDVSGGLVENAAREADGVTDLRPYGDPGDLWSHTWVLPQEYEADGTKVFACLTIPDDAELGVSANELGHLLFGFPDLSDTDGTSAGIGNWCLMAGGSWNAGGDVPAHPSTWCKAQQGWVTVENVLTDGPVTLPDDKDSRTVHRLWTGGAQGQEYFLLEHRRRTGYDSELPGDGLLVWHVDDAQEDNADEQHHLVGLLQADGPRELEPDLNRGDGGDCDPGGTTTACSAARRPRRRRRTPGSRARSSSCRRRSSACRRSWSRPAAR